MRHACMQCGFYKLMDRMAGYNIFIFIRNKNKRIESHLIIAPQLRHCREHVLMKPRRIMGRGWWGSMEMTTYRPLAEQIHERYNSHVPSHNQPDENLCFRG